MTEPSSKERPGGRTARNRAAIIDATLALVFETNPSDLTVAQIAARAGVHETTIYRRWGTKEALLSDVMLTQASQVLPMPDTGSLRGDLLTVMSTVAEFLRTPGGFAMAYIGATANDETTSAMRDTFWAYRFERARQIFERAAARGEIRDAASADLAYEALIGAMHFRILARRQRLEEGAAERLVDLILDGVR